MSDIKRVILYKHGVGYFEKRITARDKQSIDFYFKSREMNDVLKSLTIIDLGGGIISSVSYDSITPTEKLLEDISIRIPDSNSLKSLLSQVKGARIKLEVGSKSFQGAVLGLDPFTRKEKDTIIETQRLTILDDQGEMASFNLEEIKTFKILEENIRKDLEFYLKTIIFAQKKDQKKLTLFAQGEGEREILASYVLESPVWKTTYRVIMSPKEAPLLQGWAVVDNTQDEDWEDIELSLVSGLPVSFVHDLYNPRFKRRPVVHVKDEVSVAPPSFEEGYGGSGPGRGDFGDGSELMDALSEPAMFMGEEECEAAPAPMKRGRGVRIASAAMPMGGGAAQPLASSVEVKTMTQKVGDHFEYRIMNPVTIKRNQSALVPIIHQEFKGEKILIYNEKNRANNPMATLEMTNDTGLTLEGGPLTIYEQDTYIGESMMDFTKPDEKKFISYAVELGCHIEKMEFFTEGAVFQVNIAGGAMRTHYYKTREQVYKVKYKNKEATRLIIEHPRLVDWEIVDTPEPTETTQNYYRFTYELPKEGEYSFPIKDKKIFYTHYTLTTLSEENITHFLSQRFIDEKIAGEIHNLISLQQSKQKKERLLKNCRDELKAIHKDQERLRNNLSTLSDTREEQSLKERFVSKMTEQENKIESLEKEISNLQADIEKITVEINLLLTSMQSETKLEEQVK